MSRETGTWNEELRVRSYELTSKGHASLPALCNWLQEAASRHAEDLDVSITDLAELGLTWVLARLDLVIEEFPRWRDSIVVETWPSKMRGLVAQREFLVRRADEILARATSTWFVIDLTRRRPVRLPAHMQALLLPDRERAISKGIPTLPLVESPTWNGAFDVRYSDLDINRHVNHVRYLEWALETLPVSFLESHYLLEMESEFKAEVYHPSTLETQAEQDVGKDSVTILHTLRDQRAETEAARLRTHWRPA